MAEENNEQQPLDLSSLGGFGFAPAWATAKADDNSRFARFEGREGRSSERRPFGDHKPGGERRPFGDRKPRFDSSANGERPRSEGEGRRPMGDHPRGAGPRGSRRDDRPVREFVKPLDVDVRILPSQKELGPIIRKIQTTHLAYPLKQLAYLFLDNPSACMLRIAPKKDAAEVPVFHQCKACGFTALTEDEVVAHIMAEHLGDYFTSEEVSCEPPKGAFNCVAKCGLSGVLLGPPNLHGYEARIREMIRTRFPSMSEAAYRARIEMVHDAESVEAWRQSATKKTVYHRKVAVAAAPAPVPAEGAVAEGAEAAAAPVSETPALEREQVEIAFRQEILPSLLATAKTVDMSAEVALKSPSRALVFACRDAIARERRFPASLFYALRGAFHHRKLVFFRANDSRGQEFVSAVAPTVLDVTHAVPELAACVKWVEEHADALRATVPADCRSQLGWLIERGHLVCYYNGVLSVAADHPRYRPPRKPAPIDVKPAEAPASEPKSNEAAATDVKLAETPAPAPVSEAPAPETPAAEVPVSVPQVQ